MNQTTKKMKETTRKPHPRKRKTEKIRTSVNRKWKVRERVKLPQKTFLSTRLLIIRSTDVEDTGTPKKANHFTALVCTVTEPTRHLPRGKLLSYYRSRNLQIPDTIDQAHDGYATRLQVEKFLPKRLIRLSTVAQFPCCSTLPISPLNMTHPLQRHIQRWLLQYRLCKVHHTSQPTRRFNKRNRIQPNGLSIIML